MKNKFLFFILLLLAGIYSNYVQGQGNSHEQKVKRLNDSLAAEYQRERAAADVRRQRKTDANNKSVFGDQDSIFRNTSFPDKWNNQSAVVLACKNTFRYYTQGPTAYFEQTMRKKIKILDRSAIDDFSVFYFIPTDDVGFTVIKKDGTVNKINTDNAVPVDAYLPMHSFYSLLGSDDYLYSKSYKKLAITGLEPGDIIDFYYKFNTLRYKENINAVAFPPIMFTLTGKFPVVAQKAVIKAEKGFYINCSTTNSAPGLMHGNDTTGNSKTYVINDYNRDKAKDEKWEDIYRCEPTVKFQVTYSPDTSENELPYFITRSADPVTSVGISKVKEVANRIAMAQFDNIDNYAKRVNDFMKDYYRKVNDPVLYMKYAYCYLRYFLMFGNIDEEDDPSGFSYDFVENVTERPRIHSEAFVKILAEVCNYKKIDYELMFMVPRNIGTLENLIMPAELRWVLHVNGSPGVYLYPFDSFTIPGEASIGMEGIDAYTLLPNKDASKAVINKITMPISAYADNKSVYASTVTLSPDIIGDLTIERTATINGMAKNSYYPYIIAFQPLLDQELKRYHEISLSEYLTKIHNSKKREEELRKISANLEDEKKERIKDMREFFADEYDIANYEDFKLLCDGRQLDSASIIFTDKLKLKDAVHKVGQNYILDAGKLIGKQLELKDEQLTRTNDIYIGYASSNDNEIRINIPAGYKVDGIDALNVNFTNSVGGFNATAKMDGGTLIIKTTKYYSSNFEPKSSWPDIVKLMQTSFDYSQKKVLLKKA